MITTLVRMQGSWNPCALLVGMENGRPAMENTVKEECDFFLKITKLRVNI